MSVDISNPLTSASNQYKPTDHSLLSACYTISQLIAESPYNISVAKLIKDCINVVTTLLPPESDSKLITDFQNTTILDFYSKLNSDDYPLIRDNALKLSTYFGTTYNFFQL